MDHRHGHPTYCSIAGDVFEVLAMRGGEENYSACEKGFDSEVVKVGGACSWYPDNQ